MAADIISGEYEDNMRKTFIDNKSTESDSAISKQLKL